MNCRLKQRAAAERACHKRATQFAAFLHDTALCVGGCRCVCVAVAFAVKGIRGTYG